MRESIGVASGVLAAGDLGLGAQAHRPGFAQRLAWFTGFALTNWLVCLAATGVGYGLADSMPPLVRRALVFVGPLYFLLILTGETRTRHGIVALACGAVAGPLIHLVAPEWSVMMAGLVGGTLAWLFLRRRVRD